MRISDWSSDVCSSDLATIGNGCPVNVGAMATPLHAGTHGDAPLHYADDGAASADCDLAPYIGPCALLDVRHARGRVEVADIDRSEEHTSELQSLMRISYAVFCLKKKNKPQRREIETTQTISD